MELPTAGGDRGLVQQSPVQGEGRFPAARYAQEDSLSHLALFKGEACTTERKFTEADDPVFSDMSHLHC